MTAIAIRRARSDEAERLTDLCMRSKRSNGYDDAFMALCVEELRVTEDRLRNDIFLVAEAEGGEICGCASLHVEEDGTTGEVNTFFVAPDRKRQGVGRKLWEVLSPVILERQLSRVHLDADPFAVPFYRSLGFEVTGQVASGSIPGRSLPFMELNADTLGRRPGA